MNREEAKQLRIQCDKNTIWPKLKLVVALWGGCLDTEMVSISQAERFRDLLLGYLVVEHDKGKEIKLFPETVKGNIMKYTLLRKAMDFAGISIKSIGGNIKQITVYPNGTLKVEYKDDQEIEWI